METEVGGEGKNDAVDRRERGCQWAQISKHGVKRLTVKVCTNNSEKIQFGKDKRHPFKNGFFQVPPFHSENILVSSKLSWAKYRN